MNGKHTCVLNIPSSRLIVTKSGGHKLDLEPMKDIVSMLYQNPHMKSGELRPFYENVFLIFNKLMWHLLKILRERC